jgi:predicted PurR-regulated permease PerM
MHEKRATILFLLALLLIVLGFTYVITEPFLKPFAFAVILAVVFYPVHQRILSRTKHRPGTAALLSTLLLIVLFGVPAFIIATVAANEALSAARYLGRRTAEEGGLTSFALTLAERPLRFVGHWVDISKYDIKGIIASHAQRASGLIVQVGASTLSNLAGLVTGALITFLVVFFLFRDGKNWAYRAGRLMPLAAAQVARLYRDVSETIIANVHGMLFVGVAQGVMVGIGMHIVGMQSSLLLGLAAGFASIIPVVGSALIWGSVGIYLLVMAPLWKGIFLLVWGTVLGTSIDNVMRPWFVGGRVELHPLVLLFSILGGVRAFGFLGLFLGPVVASVLAALFDILREELAEPAGEGAGVAN